MTDETRRRAEVACGCRDCFARGGAPWPQKAEAAVKGKDDYWKKWVDEYNRTLQSKIADLNAANVQNRDLTARLAAAERERNEFRAKYHDAMEVLSRWSNVDKAEAIGRALESERGKTGDIGGRSRPVDKLWAWVNNLVARLAAAEGERENISNEYRAMEACMLNRVTEADELRRERDMLKAAVGSTAEQARPLAEAAKELADEAVQYSLNRFAHGGYEALKSKVIAVRAALTSAGEAS